MREHFRNLFESVRQYSQIRFKEAQIEDQFSKLFKQNDEVQDDTIKQLMKSMAKLE